MKIIDAKTMDQVDSGQIVQLLAKEYEELWTAKYGGPPEGMHPIPSNVGEYDVQFFIVFS
jgi:hypothetical protein